METKTKIKGTVLTLAVSVMISMILQTIRHKLQVCGLSAYNVEDTFATAYIIGISYASVIYAHFCYKNMKEPSDFFRWFKDNAFIHIQTAVVLCFSVLKYTRYVFFFRIIPIAIGCLLFPLFYSGVYYLMVRLFRDGRAGLTAGLVLCTMELIQIGFYKEVRINSIYDFWFLFGGFVAFYHYDMFEWITHIVLVTLLVYTAAITVDDDKVIKR